jgi:hypothetical protein
LGDMVASFVYGHGENYPAFFAGVFSSSMAFL